MNSEQNKSTLIELFENLGPGQAVWDAAYDKALAQDCSWWVQGWPVMLGIEEAKAQVTMLKVLNINANPILEWRNIEAFENGRRFIFERRGSVADAEGKTLADWDIMGIFSFNDDGKIASIRDYFDNSSLYDAVRKVMPEEQIKQFHQLSRDGHPLKPDCLKDSHFYRNMCQKLAM